ncbi:MAG: DUF1501 domain-containing protein [Planctomycetaceae bacterium]|nr:DUF1501 domain-containing protein [Planctomycetaceae bacterium]
MHQPARSAADFSARPAGIPGQSSSTGRRGFLRRSADGLHAAALMYLFGRDFYGGRSVAASEKADLPRSRRQYDLLPKQTHFPARAKAVIHLCMQGGPSQVDLFDPKPMLDKHHGEDVPESITRDAIQLRTAALMRSPWKFTRHGQSGLPVSELLPHLAREADELAVIRSMYNVHPNHEPAVYKMQTGKIFPGHPTFGSWIAYGLGSENANLPAYVVLADPENRLLWRMNTGRMEAEVLRDSLLHCAGQLDFTMGGQELENNTALTTHRRSVYYSVFPENGGASDLGILFDAPNPLDCYRRTESIVPQQALALTNSELVHQLSKTVVQEWEAALKGDTRAPGDAEAQTERFVSEMFEKILSRTPTAAEQQVCREALAAQQELLTAAKAPDAASAARASLVRALLNHNDFVTIR